MLRNLASEEDLLILLAEGDRTHWAHAEFAHHAAGRIAGLLDVVAGAGGHLLEEDFLGGAAAHHNGQAGFEIVLGIRVLVVERQLHGDAQRHSTRNDRNLVHGVGMIAHGGNQRVASLVISRDLLLFVAEQHALALCAHEHFVLGQFEVIHEYGLAILAGGVECSLVHHAGEIGAGEARCATRQNGEIDVVGDRNLASVYAENLFASANVRTGNHYAAIKAAGAQQRRIKNVRTVGRSDQDHAVVGFKAVHFDEKLIQRLLALIVSAAEAGASMASHSVDFVDEDDTGRVLLALFEEVADAACADADKHLDEVRTGDREERNIRFACDCTCEQGLTGSGRPDQEHALGDASAELLEFLRLAQKFNDLFELFFRFVHASHVFERDFLLLHREQARAALAER